VNPHFLEITMPDRSGTLSKGETIIGEVLDTTKLCGSFPVVFGTEIIRENVLHTLETFFEGETQLLIVESSSKYQGIGKTVLLSQFARRNPDRSLSVFIRPTSWFAYDPSIALRDLCNQISWVLFREEIAGRDEIGDAYLSQLIFDLQKYARRSQRSIVFIVDGITDVPKDRLPVRDVILSKLPFGFPQFRFLFSGSIDEILKLKIPKLVQKVFTLAPFSLDETVSYFGQSLSREMALEVFKVSHGVPGYLSRVRRLLDSGIPASDLLEQLPNTDPELFEIEWKAVESASEKELEFIALLAHDRNKHTGAELASIFQVDYARIKGALERFTFLDVPESPHSEIEFVSDTYRKYACQRLARHKDLVNEMVIDWLLKTPDSDQSISLLPVYFQDAGEDEQLLSYLSPDHLGRMLEKTGVITPVRERTQLGVETALRLRRDEDLTRLSLQSSVIAGLDDFHVSRSEVEARLALQDVESCIALAQAAVLKEDRLRLLALISRKLREMGNSPEPELLDQIDQLSREVDFSSFSADRAVEFAEDLMYARPELAMVVLEKAASGKNGGTGQASLDWALAALSIQAMLSEERDLKSVAETFKTKIADPDVVSFSTAASVLFGGYTASDVIAELDRVKNPRRKLALLRQWALHARNQPDTAAIIEHALTLGIKTTEYSPNATHLRELATPLPQINDSVAVFKLIASFDTQRATIETLGPTEDYVRLQLTLAEAESRFDQDACSRRLEECYLYISYIGDLAVKTASEAALTATLLKIDPLCELENKSHIHSVAESDLDSDLKKLLATTAQHSISTRRIIEALATVRPEKGLQVCMELNVEARRDSALHTLIKRILRQPTKDIPFRFLQSALEKFGDPSERDQAVNGIIERAVSVKTQEVLDKIINDIIPILGQSRNVASAGLRVRASCGALQIVKRSTSPEAKRLEAALHECLTNSWAAMDEDWRKIDMAFNVSSKMASCCKDLAKEYLQLAESLKASVALENPALNYSTSMRLSVRSFAGLAANKIDSKEEFGDLSSRIERLPSVTSRLEMWADLALRCVAHSRLGESKHIVDHKVQPLLQELEKMDREEWCNYVELCAPALYSAHARNTLDLLSKLPEHWKNSVCCEIVDFICRKIPSSDPYVSLGHQTYNLGYEEICEIIDVLEVITDDARIYWYISNIIEAAKRRKPALSQQQKAAIVQRLRLVVKNAFPSKKGIQHNGWIIVSNAELMRLQRSEPQDWTQLIDQLKAIPNTADQAFSSSLVAQAIWSFDPIRGSELFKESVALADTIPALFHRVDALHDIAQNASAVAPEFAKLCLSRAAEIASGQKDSDIGDAQRNIVDLANILSPEFGSTLAAMMDSDPARKDSIKTLKQRLEMDELRKKMLDESVSVQGIFLEEEEKVREGAWRNLGALNANRIETVHVRHAREYMRCASRMPISSAYAVFAWAIENNNRRMQMPTDEQASVLRAIFRATLQGCDLSSWVATKMSGRLQQGAYKGARESHVMRAGEREKALLRIRDWLEKTASEYIKISDQFIGPAELSDILRLVLRSNSKLRVHVVTSRKWQNSEKIAVPWEDAYRLRWRLSSDQEPPDTRVVVAGLPNGDSPLHDRWWITKGAGLRLGTSFNSVGTSKGSEITEISTGALLEFESEINACLDCSMRGKAGEKVVYSSFTL
jgi:hypothetical protein